MSGGISVGNVCKSSHSDRASLGGQDLAAMKAMLRSATERTPEGLWAAIGRFVDAFGFLECVDYCIAAGHRPDLPDAQLSIFGSIWLISSVCEVVRAVGCGECVKCRCDGCLQCADGSGRSLSQDRHDLENACSIGLKSGLYGGRKSIDAPVALLMLLWPRWSHVHR